MLPMEFPDKRRALLDAFLSRFAIGFLIPLVKMPIPMWAVGAVVGLLISLPDAVITKAYAPILGTGYSEASLSDGRRAASPSSFGFAPFFQPLRPARLVLVAQGFAGGLFSS